MTIALAKSQRSQGDVRYHIHYSTNVHAIQCHFKVLSGKQSIVLSTYCIFEQN